MSPENTQTLINLLMLLALFAALAIWWQTKHGGNRGRIAERARLAVRNQQLITAPEDEVVEEEAFKARLVRRLGALGEKLPLFDAKYRAKLQRDMVHSGYRSQSAASVLLSVKFCFGLAAAAVTIMMGTHLPVVGPYPLMRGVAMLGAFIVGMMIPEYAVSFSSSRRKKRMAGSLPDALDLLVICTNAGNSLAVSIRRVADELATICPPLSEEFMLTADELKLSGDSTRALMSLGERIDLPSIRALISTLTQSMRYGTPITQALRTLSRTERLQHIVSLEEKAAKLAPKMVLPMMLFILPAVVAVAAGPAVIQLMDFLHK